MLYSVIVPTRDKRDYLAATLPALLRSAAAAGRSCEVIVVDDGSRDETPELLTIVANDFADAAGPALRALRQPPAGLAAARNTGAAVARGRQLVFLDDDVLVAPDFFDVLAPALARHPEHVHMGRLRNVCLSAVPNVLAAAAAGRTVAADDLVPHCTPVQMYEALSALFAGAARSEAPGARQPAVWRAVVTGGNLCVPRATFERVGGFDEAFAGWGPEDADLCFQLFNRGLGVAFHPAASLFHLDHPRDRRAATDAMVRNVGHFLKKHGKPRELYEYLHFCNGTLSLGAFNNAVAARCGAAALEVPPFFLDLRYVTTRAQFLRKEVRR
jgi:GT2 family glycosyltransferase